MMPVGIMDLRHRPDLTSRSKRKCLLTQWVVLRRCSGERRNAESDYPKPTDI